MIWVIWHVVKIYRNKISGNAFDKYGHNDIMAQCLQNYWYLVYVLFISFYSAVYINYSLLDMIRIKHTLPLINEKKIYDIEYTGQTCVQALCGTQL